MRKKYFKKGVACLLSAALVLTGTGVMPGAAKTVSAAVADDVASALLKKYDMKSSSGITVAGTNSAGVTIKDGVLTVPGEGWGTGYAVLDADFSQIDDGVTIAFKAKIDNTDAWAPLLSFQWDANSWSNDADYTFNEKANFWALRTNLNTFGNVKSSNIWYDGPTPDAPAISGADYDDIALTIDATAIKVYKNGVEYTTLTELAQGTVETLFGYIKNNSPKLRLGNHKCHWDWLDFKGSYKEVSIYKRALTATEISYLVTGQEEKADSLISAPTASINGNQLEIGYTTDITPDSVEVTVGGTKVNPQNGKYLYTPSKAGEYEFTITAKKSGYINDVEKLTVKVATENGKLVFDEELIQGLKVSADNTKLSVSWTPLNDAAVTAELVAGDGKKVSIAADGSVDLSGLTNKMTYTVTATAKKDGFATKAAEKTFIYRKGKPFEVLTGTAWWNANEVGKDYAFSGNGTMVLDVDFIGPQAEANGAFSVEALDDDGKVITTGSDINIWGNGCGSYSYVNGTPLAGKITPGHKYRITIERNNTNLAVTYYDVTAKKQHCKMTSSDCALTENFNVHVMGQVGSFQVHKCSDILDLSADTLSVQKGKTGTLELTEETFPEGTTITGATAADATVAAVEVSGGKVVVTGLKDGKTTVTVTGSNGETAVCEVTVYEKNIAVTDVALNRQTATLEEGGTLTLVATVSPEDAIEKGVIWSSDNELAATVDSNGKVTAVKAGTAKITAASKENAAIFAVCTVTVKEKSLPDEEDKTLKDESQLGTYRSDLEYNRVSVHDPSVVRDPKTNRYYIFGSHCAWAWSDDLENWTSFTNNITEGENGSANTIFADEIAWCKNANTNYSVTGNLWAPDVIWDSSYKNSDGTTGAWLMYMSINGPNWNSTISLLTSDRLDGNWTYVGPVIQSGMSKGFGVTFDYEKVTGESTVNSRYTDNVSRGGNPTLEAHAIDPCVLYDENGDLWMSYGSWSGGISMIKLDKETGLRDYSMAYADTNNKVVDGVVSDPYTGYKIAGGGAVSGEGSYIKKIGDSYFLFLSYGPYDPQGGYNMRIFRSSDIKGPYTDVAGKDARQAVNTSAGNVTGSTGMRLMSYYKWNFADYGYTAQGHNSATVDAASGKAFVIYHNKYDDGTAAHEVRVHQLLTNEDGWILSAPFEYAGETVESAGYEQNVFTGDYGLMLQKQNVDHAKLQCTAEQKIKLEAGTETADGGYTGKITGDYTGTWESKADSPYVTLKIGNTTYKGVFCEGTFDETDVKTMTFTAVGDNQECLWGYKVMSPTVAIRMTIDKVIKLPDTVATDIPLPTTGVGGSTITWKSNSAAIADDGTIPHLFNEDSTVSMTATITNNGYQFAKNYEFTVLGNTKLASESDVAIKKFYTDTELDMSKLAGGNCPSVPNPFYYTHEDISNGVSISFDAVRNTPIDHLSNLISFNNKLGRMYFTGGGYLGFNDFNGRFIDANLNGDYTVGKDYLPANTKVTIKIEITSSGFTVYQNGTKVYSFADVKSGTVSGNIGGINPELTMLSWLRTAPELNFGSGNFWGDIFKGKISNVVCSYKQPEVDVSGSSSLSGIYVQDYEKVSNISTEWTSTNAQGNLSIGSGDAEHGKYMLYDFTGETGTNSRGAHSYFGEDIEWPDGYILEYDMALKAGNNQGSQVAVLTSNAAYSSNNENNGLTTGYVFKLTTTNSEVWTINDDSTKTVTIPKSAWVHVTLTGTKGSTAAHLEITNGDTVLFDGEVTATDTGTIKGLYMLAGRYQATFKVDNIVVKDQDVDYGVRAVYEKILARAEQFAALQEESPVYTSDSYKVLADAITAAKDSVTDASTNDDLNAHIEALQAAIDGLQRAYYTVTVTASENGKVTGLATDGKYFAGDSITLTAVPDEGYEFSGWKVGDEIVSENTVYSAMVAGNITITPVFEKSEAPAPTPTPGDGDDTTPTPTPDDGSGTTPTPTPTGGSSGSGSGGGGFDVPIVIPPTPSTTPTPSITPEPSKTPAPSDTPKPTAPVDPGTTPTPDIPTLTPDVPGTTPPSVTPAPADKNTVKKGNAYTVSGKKFKVTSVTSKKKTVTLTKVTDKSLKNLKIGATVKIKNQSFKITAIAPKAFANCKKLETVIIGKNVISLGAQCFAGCSSLKKVTFKTKILNAIGKNAFKGINKKAVIKVPKAQLKKYKKLLKKKVQPSTVRITK